MSLDFSPQRIEKIERRSFVYFLTAFRLGKVTGPATLGGIKIHHRFQQPLNILMALRQGWAISGSRATCGPQQRF